MGSPAYRRAHKLALRLGPRPKVSAETCQMLVDPSENLIRDQLYEAQIEYYKLPIKKRARQNRLKKTTSRGRRYKQAYIPKEISIKKKPACAD